MVPSIQRSVFPILCSLDKVGAYRVAFDVATDSEEMRVVLNGEAFERPLIDMSATASLMMRVVSQCVGGSEPTTKFAHPTILSWPQNKMPVIGHEAKREQVDRVFIEALTQRSQECPVVIRFVKDLLPSIPAVDGMIDHPGFIWPLETWHLMNLMLNSEK